MALVTVRRSPSNHNPPTSLDEGAQDDNMETNRSPKSLSECYFAGKGTALVLPVAEAQKSNRRTSDTQGSNIRKHLQSIVDLLRPEETLKMAVKLESVHPNRIRYLVIVSRMGKRAEESCLLGIDCNEKTTVGLVLRVMADTTIRLDGDGGFSVSVCNRHHIFKPVSVQAMWSALQTLHKVSSKARDQNYYQSGLTHDWVNYYEKNIESDRSCLNEWHAMDNLESKRPPSPDSIRLKPREHEETEKVIRTTLKEIMMSVDLDEVTSKYIRSRLEEDLDMDLGEYKSFIDQEMLTILGQMDAPTEIFDHVYLGSEWNASNYEELQRNGVGHILNVTREIDNFFPGTFNYYNVRVCDDEKTDLLKYWDDTFKYITNAKQNGSKVLVHCKMGVSRSASVVIAYAMKAYNWDFQTAMHHVKEKRTCIKPNTSFLSQLETYQGILDAMKNKEKLQRSKSETNLKSPSDKIEKIPPGGEPTPIVGVLLPNTNHCLSGQELRNLGTRPKSWSPDNQEKSEKSPISVSLEDLSQNKERHVLMPCDNGDSYSVSPNQIVNLSVKERVNELESKKEWDPGEDQIKKLPTNDSTSNSCDSSVLNKKDGDPFSNQLDRVFDREEKTTNCPSRQNSWSSYDSAVVLGLSRHSSWGSGDARLLPSRNSSWGSYDMRGGSGIFPYDKEDIPWHPGTVKRTKQKIEDGKVSSSSIKIPNDDKIDIRLSASAPEASTMDLVSSDRTLSRSASNGTVKQHRTFLENLSKDLNQTTQKSCDNTTLGIVRSRKKEFEAKTEEVENKKNKINSLPSSPDKVDERNVKNLLGLFENNKEVIKRPKSGNKVQKNLRHSCVEVSKWKNEKGAERPPISPVVRNASQCLVASVIASATKKQQQYGKSHPLARLTMKPRHNNPLYNTM